MRPVTAKIWELCFNISALAEAGDLKFGVQLGFAKAHHKITPRRKEGMVLGYGSFPKLAVLFNIFFQRLKLVTKNLVKACVCLGPS